MTALAAADLRNVRAAFAGGRSYLAACTVGLPTHSTRAAVLADLDASAEGRASAAEYTAVVERSRGSFARLVGVDPARIAIGSQASVFAGLIAASVPDGAEVLCVEGDFSSMVLPFAHAGRGIRLRTAPLDALADSVTADTWLVAFSLVQSATGQVADAAAIRAAATRHGARTLCDATQAIGWMPVDAADFDAVICHAYKWLCAPRGVAFMAIGDGLRRVRAADLRGLVRGSAIPGCPAMGMRSSSRRTRRGSMSRPPGRRSSARSRRSSCSPRSTPRHCTPMRRAWPRRSARDSDSPSPSARARSSPGPMRTAPTSLGSPPPASWRRAAPDAPVSRSTCSTTRTTFERLLAALGR